MPECLVASPNPAAKPAITSLPARAFAAGLERPSHAVANRAVRFPDGSVVPAVGQGSWHLGQDKHPPAVEEDAVKTGLSLGMTLIDTSGNYGNGRLRRSY